MHQKDKRMTELKIENFDEDKVVKELVDLIKSGEGQKSIQEADIKEKLDSDDYKKALRISNEVINI